MLEQWLLGRRARCPSSAIYLSEIANFATGCGNVDHHANDLIRAIGLDLCVSAESDGSLFVFLTVIFAALPCATRSRVVPDPWQRSLWRPGLHLSRRRLAAVDAAVAEHAPTRAPPGR